jgi:hypothetical protein
VGEIINNNRKNPSFFFFSIDFKKDSNKQMLKKDVREEAGKSWNGFFCLVVSG